MTDLPGIIYMDRIPKPESARPQCQVLVGTSGYSYAEWVKHGVYPPGTKTTEMLPEYARSFSIAELDSTFYQIPKGEAVVKMMLKD